MLVHLPQSAREPKEATMSLSNQQIQILRAMSEDSTGRLLYSRHWGGSGLTLQTNGQDFAAGANAREVATLEDDLIQLQRYGYIVQEVSGRTFKITKLGYDFVDAVAS